ncbi:glycosyltransferase family 4 protein [Flavobacterium daemonense]|uniref:glycosyltransferase family 4 protein n=1 Tax=Flavobacterium daemonense TaxID=1393049 RepID=UPI001184E17D|nr:glycosyltransferase family 4 protein [Flavobacterium daemonense]KAF2333120.1 glycosyltransferase family 4 protein [Flavobacterium daemonense]
MRVLITTPFFSNLGGSELETIHTANAIAALENVKQIDIFVYSIFDLSFCEDIEINSKIKFISYPAFFKNKILQKLNRLIKNSCDFDFSPIEYLYWKFTFVEKYNNVYIITKSTLNYYIPIIKLYPLKQKIVVKFTTIFFEDMPTINLRYLSLVKENLVTSESQKNFFQEHLGLKNTIVQEVIIFKEDYGLSKVRKYHKTSLYDFGILSRFSSEKKIEDAINLIEKLKTKGYNKTLLIRGIGDQSYYENLLKIVKDKKLIDSIVLEFESVPYDAIFDFFDRINCFLITSKYEGGPNIGLEVMAYGLPILSYKVGAMPDRLIDFPEFIAEGELELVDKAIGLINWREDIFVEKCQEIKSRYMNNYSNKTKKEYLRNFLST